MTYRRSVHALLVAIAGVCIIGVPETTASEPNRVKTTPKAASTPEAPCERVAAVAPFAVDMLLKLGVRPVLVPMVPGTQPESWAELDTLRLTHRAGPNLEQLVAASPDLVVTTSTYAAFTRAIERVTDAHVETLDIRSVDDVRTTFRRLGVLTGRVAEAEKAIITLNEEIEAVRAPTKDREPQRVLAVFGSVASMYAFRTESLLGEMVQMLGGQIVPERGEPHALYRELSPISLEGVIAARPDVVLVLAHGSSQAIADEIMKHPVWSRVPAVQAGRLVSLPEEQFVLRPGSDTLESLRVVRAALYPEFDVVTDASK